jgi:hypothetical protein
MSTQPGASGESFRDRLFDAETMTPELHDAYLKELDALIHERHTPRSRMAPILLALICVACVAGEIWALAHYRGKGTTFYLAAVTMLLACASAAAWLARDLARGKSVRKQSLKMPELFYGAAGVLTVATLMQGLGKSSDPASTFNALYVFVFLFVCAIWGLGNRIAAATLETREHLLRIEARLAEMEARGGTK